MSFHTGIYTSNRDSSLSFWYE